MVLDGLGSLIIIWVARAPFTIAHDENALHTFALASVLEIFEISHVFGFVLEKLVDVLDRIDSVLLLGNFWKIEVRHFALPESTVKGPFGKRNLKPRADWLGAGKDR